MTNPNTDQPKTKVAHTLTPVRDPKTDIIGGAGDTSSIPDASGEVNPPTKDGEDCTERIDYPAK